MGDHRATVKIEFTFHGKTEKGEWWINWWPYSEHEGIDQRIIDWFREKTVEGMARFDEQMTEYWRQENEAATKKAELAELDRLKSKYERA